MSKHTKWTPGPWIVETSGDEKWISSINENVYHGDIVCEAPTGYTESMKRWEANARLIAAAPELAEALRGIVQWMEQHHPEAAKNIPTARAALAKAGVS